jgi:hypothetical protein
MAPAPFARRTFCDGFRDNFGTKKPRPTGLLSGVAKTLVLETNGAPLMIGV